MTQTQIDNFTLWLQCKLANKNSSFLTTLEIGEYSIKDGIKLIFATIAYKIIANWDVEESCLEEEDVCKLISFVKKYFRDCGC